MFDPMADLADGSAQDSNGAAVSAKTTNNQFGEEIHSITIRAKQRTFYIDLKQSANGKFFKISEKSRGGRKTTIMFDAEDLQAFIDALAEMKEKI